MKQLWLKIDNIYMSDNALVTNSSTININSENNYFFDTKTLRNKILHTKNKEVLLRSSFDSVKIFEELRF